MMLGRQQPLYCRVLTERLHTRPGLSVPPDIGPTVIGSVCSVFILPREELQKCPKPLTDTVNQDVHTTFSVGGYITDH